MARRGPSLVGGSENTETSLAEKPLTERQGSIACDKHHRVIAILLLLSVILESRHVWGDVAG